MNIDVSAESEVGGAQFMARFLITWAILFGSLSPDGKLKWEKFAAFIFEGFESFCSEWPKLPRRAFSQPQLTDNRSHPCYQNNP